MLVSASATEHNRRSLISEQARGADAGDFHPCRRCPRGVVASGMRVELFAVSDNSNRLIASGRL